MSFGAPAVREVEINLTEGQKASADDTPDAARRYVNWLIDNNETIRVRPAIVNTDFAPGTYNRTSGVSAGIIGVYLWNSTWNQRDYLVYARADRTLWCVDVITTVVTALSSSSDITTKLDGNGGKVTFAEDSQRLVMAAGGQLQIWTGQPGALSSRISTYALGTNQPPQSATHVLSINNYLVANNAALPGFNNQIFWSNLGDGNHATWNPLNFNTADADADQIVALGANLRQVYAFGTRTVQVFGIGSDPYLPFPSSSALVLGCGAAYSPIAIDGGGFAILDTNRRFCTTDGSSSTWISRDIDKLLRDMTTVSDCFGFRLRIGFWDLLVWIFPSSGKGYAFDQARNTWHQILGWNGVDDFAAARISSYAFWAKGNLHFVGDPLYENLWTLNYNGLTDTGPNLPIVCDMVTERLDQGTAGRKRCARVRFMLRRGASTVTPNPTLDVSKRDDDGPWSAFQQLDLGTAGDYRSFVDWFPGGVYRRRQYRVRYSGGQATSIRKMVEFVEPRGD